MWDKGIIEIGKDTFIYHAKVFALPSELGINCGRISKLEIRRQSDDAIVVQYDRGWVVRPKTKVEELALQQVLDTMVLYAGYIYHNRIYINRM